MDSVIARLIVLDEENNEVQCTPMGEGGGVCHIVPDNKHFSDTKLTLRLRQDGETDSAWEKTCILFKTSTKPQLLTITLDTAHRHPNNLPTDKPLFHFIRIETKRYKLIKEIRCFTGLNPNVYQTVGYAQGFPDHTHTIKIVFDMDTTPGTKTLPFDIDLFTIRLDTFEVENHDPQVGNEPP